MDGNGAWFEEWKKESPGWQAKDVTKFLIDYWEKRNDNRLNVFLPFCGKSLDIKWISDRSLSFVGVELVPTPVEQFFRENDIPYYITQLQNNDKLYQNPTGSLKIYSCNLFDFPKYNSLKFDFIWDKGAFGAVSPNLRKKYADVIKELYSKKCEHLLDVLSYPTNEFSSHPFSVSMSDVCAAFGNDVKIELLETLNCTENLSKILGCNFTYVKRSYFLITQ